MSAQQVIVVDSDPVQRGTLAAFIEILGFEPVQAGDAQGVVEASAGGARVAVTEWSVPGLEGAALTSALQPGRRSVLLFTGRDLDELGDAWKQTGVAAAFPKNRRADMLNMMKQLMSGNAGSPASASGGESGVGRQFLVVEDSPTMRGFIRRSIEHGFPGCVVREAADGKAALAELAHGRVHCIVTDLQMPGMDGWTFLSMIRANPVLKARPVVVFSSAISAETMDKYKADPLVRFLDKPSVGEKIVLTLKEMLPAA